MPQDSVPSLRATTVVPNENAALQRRDTHRAAFDATLKEVFLKVQVRLSEQLGEMSKETVVYGGTYQGEEVAVKIFTFGAEEIADVASSYGAFKVECEKTMILSRRSRAIVQVFEYGDAELPLDMPQELREFFPLGLVPYMITERAPYGSLDRVAKQWRKLPGFDRVSLMEAVAAATDGIKEAHDHQVAHRDIKPQNLLIFGPREGKIADFGVARWRSRIDHFNKIMLTPRYCSPEQALHALTGRHEGLVGIAADIYSWAIMVYELVTGKHPFEWAVKGQKDAHKVQHSVLKAIAGNDRRGFVPTGDITFDSLIDRCTCELKYRIRDIATANRVLRELVRRMRLGQQS
ncbi:MAG: protein kinase [Planctomycetota bacterium]|jgi:serine/threonine protein kinase|nr:protein kinase [Planctomycetota bacterium]